MKKMIGIAMAFMLVFNALSAQTKTDKAPAGQGIVYTCPMHSEIISDRPGTCPKCGMTLVVKKTYTCPMHPDVVSNKPGKCPKCGMTLVEKTAAGGKARGGMKKDSSIKSINK